MADDVRWIPPVAGPAETAAGLLAALAGRAAAPVVRGALRSGMHRLFRGDADVAGTASEGDAGWFGPDSVTWRVQADPSMFVGGIAALLFQALHPLAMAAVADHSDYRVDPMGRLRRTAAFVGVTAYGTSAEASAMCAAISQVHGSITGYAPDGRAYAAADPALLGWVHVAEFAGFAAANRRFAADPMDAAELDRYVGEVARVGEALGVLDPPRSWPGLVEQLLGHRPDLAVNEQTRSVWAFLRRAHTMLPAAARPAYELLFGGAVACLPPWARRLWGARMPSTFELAACRALVRGIDAAAGEPPRLADAKRRAAVAAGRSSDVT